MVGAIIVHPDLFIEGLSEFVIGNNEKEILSVIKKFKSEGMVWDLQLVYASLHQELKIFVNTITNDENNLIQCPSLFKSYLSKLKDYKLALCVKEITTSHAQSPLMLADKVKEAALKYSNEDDTNSLKDVLSQVLKQIENSASQKDGMNGVPSGINAIDRITWGFQPSRMYIIAGRPSMGKSALGMNIAYNAAKAGKRVYVQSLEESSQSFMTRMLALASGIDVERLFRGQIDESEWGLINSKLNYLNSLPLIIDERASVSSSKIASIVKKEAMKQKIDLVVIDHLQQIKENAQNRHLEISQAAFTLKELSKELKTPVIAMCQLNRGVEMRADKHPMMSDLKESGDIEAIADIVMLLYRQAYYDHQCIDRSKVELGIAKNRDGRTGLALMSWNPKIMKFSDY